MAGNEFDIDPNKLNMIKAAFDDNARSVKLLKGFVQDYNAALKGLDSSALIDAKKNLDLILKSIKDQEKNINAVTYAQNMQKIVGLQMLVTNQNLTRESQKRIMHEMRNLEIQNEQLEVGYEAASLGSAKVKTTEEHVALLGAEMVSASALTKDAKKRLELEIAKANATEKYVKLGKDIVKVNEEDLKNSDVISKRRKDIADNAAKSAAGAVGLELSLGGIIKKLIEGYDATNRLEGMARQINTHWAQGNTFLGETQDRIQDLSRSFKVSIDVAGQYLRQLSMSGMQHKDMAYFAKELYAREVDTGQSIASQVATIKELRTEYGQTNQMATGFLEEVRNIQKTLPYMNLDEITEDLVSLGQNSKAFNLNLLGTIGMYKTLMRDSKALTATGLGALPRSFRKELGESLSKMSAEMPLGYKAFFGRGIEGTQTPAQAILAFEKLGAQAGGPFKQLSLVVDKINKVMPNAPREERTLMVRQMLGNLGIFSQNLIYQLSPLIESNKLSKDSIDKLIAREKAERPAWVKDLGATFEKQTGVIESGVKTSELLHGLLERIMNAITNFIIDLLRGIYELTAEIKIGLPKWLKWENKEDTTLMEEKNRAAASWTSLKLGAGIKGMGIETLGNLPEVLNIDKSTGSAMAAGVLDQTQKLLNNPIFAPGLKNAGVKTTNELLDLALARSTVTEFREMQTAVQEGRFDEFYAMLLRELRDTSNLFKQTTERKTEPVTNTVANPKKPK